jgi:hypothetical protein
MGVRSQADALGMSPECLQPNGIKLTTDAMFARQ